MKEDIKCVNCGQEARWCDSVATEYIRKHLAAIEEGKTDNDRS